MVWIISSTKDSVPIYLNCHKFQCKTEQPSNMWNFSKKPVSNWYWFVSYSSKFQHVNSITLISTTCYLTFKEFDMKSFIALLVYHLGLIMMQCVITFFTTNYEDIIRLFWKTIESNTELEWKHFELINWSIVSYWFESMLILTNCVADWLVSLINIDSSNCLFIAAWSISLVSRHIL